MAFTAFQSNAFQRNAYQIVAANGNAPSPSGGKPNNAQSYELGRNAWLLEQQRVSREAGRLARLQQAKQAEIDRLEARRKDDLANQVKQIELRDMLMQMAKLEAEQAKLAQLLAFWRDEEDAIMIILLTMGI